MKKYSVIIPVYNCEKYLVQCINSIIKQTFSFCEIILIDDGSTDGSGVICDEIASKYDNVFVYHKENGGASSARNLGLEKATSDYIIFVDGDDTIEVTLLEQIDAIRKQGNVDLIVYGMAFDYYDNEKLVKTDYLSNKYNDSVLIKNICNDFDKYFYNNILSSACNKVFDAKIIKNNHIQFDESMRLYEDLNFVLNYLCHVREVRMLDICLYHYRNELKDTYKKSRITDLNHLSNDLVKVMASLVNLEEMYKSNGVMSSLAANLYMQYLVINLIYDNKKVKDKLKDLIEYFHNQYFVNLINNNKVVLTESNKSLFDLLRKKKYNQVFIKYKLKRVKIRLKNIIKIILKRV